MTHELCVQPIDIVPDAAGAVLRFPLSSSQERCWFINALDPGSTALNVALRWELRGRIDRSLVEDAFAAIVARHEALRTRIVEDDGTPMQEVQPFFRPIVSEIDLSGMPEQRRADEALRIGQQEAHKAFDPTDLPLIRISLLRMAPEQAFLLLTVHQIAFDGWSIRLISHEFGVTAAALRAGRKPDLPVLPLQYGDYAAWQAAYFASQHFDREVTYWTSRLRGAPYFEVPGDRPRGARPTVRGDIIAMLLPDDLAAAMLRKVKAESVTPFSFGCAVIAATLHRRTGADDISIATQVGGREDPDLEPLIGVFINNLVLRFDLTGEPTFTEVLARANRTVQDALIHQAMPFHRLVGILKPPRDPSRMPLISVNFTVLQDVMENARYGDLDLIGHPSLSAGSLYDLNFFLVHWSTGWRMAVEYNPDLFDKSTGEALLALWLETFEDALGDAGFTLATVEQRAIPPAANLEQPKLKALSALLTHPDVAEAVMVDVGPSAHGQVAPHAVVTLRADFKGSVSSASTDLLRHLSRLVPQADRPAALEVWISLPRLPGGGVDRSALARSINSAARSDDAVVAVGAPSDDTIGTLLELWMDILKVDGLTIDSNFFDCGGHSLLALRMLSRVERVFKQKVDVATLFNAPTVRSLAAVLTAAETAVTDWKIVPIQADGTRTPLLVINNTVAYYNLARKLGPDRPVIGIQLFDPSENQDLEPRDFRDIVRDYVSLIRVAQPRGPYALMGLCVAGVIAYEAAQQLRDAGEDVALVVMADTWRPGYLATLPRWRGLLFRSVYRWHVGKRHWRKIRNRDSTVADVLATYPSIRRSGLLELASKIGLITSEPLNREDWRNRWFLPHLETSRNDYDPNPARGKHVLLQSDEVVDAFVGSRMGWERTIIDDLTTLRVPGWHVDMFQDKGAHRIAASILPLLEAVDQRAVLETPTSPGGVPPHVDHADRCRQVHVSSVRPASTDNLG